MRPKLNEDRPWEGDFFSKETRRAYQLLGSPTCAREVIMHPLYQATCDKPLITKNWFWSGNRKTYAVSKPQIMNTVCFSINPEANKQPLHRDDWCYHVVAEKADVYPEDLQRDTGIGWFVAGKDATFENGCTRFIPGSHLWAHKRQPDDALWPYDDLKRGDAFMMFASCYHGGGANTTADQEEFAAIEKEYEDPRHQATRMAELEGFKTSFSVLAAKKQLETHALGNYPISAIYGRYTGRNFRLTHEAAILKGNGTERTVRSIGTSLRRGRRTLVLG